MKLKLLMMLYPKAWRERYEQEYRALLEESNMSTELITDVIKNGIIIRAKINRSLLVTLVGVVWYLVALQYCLHAKITQNVVWAPTTMRRAIALIITATPLFLSIYLWISLAANGTKTHSKKHQ